MNLNKARDFYSAYYEQTLDDGLRQAFERAMELDAQVSAEYRQFVRIMEHLKGFEAPVEVPADLHAKIRERVDAHIIKMEQKAKQPSWFFGWKPIAYGAVAAVAIIAGLVSISNSGSKDVSVAGMGASITDTSPSFKVEEGVLTLRFSSTKGNLLTITDLESGHPLFAGRLARQQFVGPLKNSADSAVVVSVTFGSDYDPFLVAVPGTRVSTETTGTGTLAEMAKALSDRYASPVVIANGDATKLVSWKFDGTDALNASKDELDELGMKSEIREGGLVWVSAN